MQALTLMKKNVLFTIVDETNQHNINRGKRPFKLDTFTTSLRMTIEISFGKKQFMMP